MNISFIGSFGTVKTTIAEYVAENLSADCYIIEDQLRNICKNLDYSQPRYVIFENHPKDYSLALNAMISYCLGHFSLLNFNQAAYNLADYDPINYYAFYLFWLKRIIKEKKVNINKLKFTKKLIEFYLSNIDINFYFSINSTPLASDDIRENNYTPQAEIDNLLHQCFHRFTVNNLVFIQSNTIEERYDEIDFWINKLKNQRKKRNECIVKNHE